MNAVLRKAQDRGHAHHGWLDSWHTFSFADYHDPAHIHYRALRVINDDRIAPAQGFGTHPHRDMEILTYMLEGELEHRDSMGNGRIIRSGEVQGMSAGIGITHSEFNASRIAPAHLLQVWIMPHTKNVTPSYGEWLPDGSEKTGWALAASGDAGGIRIHQDARMHVATPPAGATLNLPVAKGRYGWLQIGAGAAQIGDQLLREGDGLAFDGGALTELKITRDAKLLLFDLA